MQEIETQIETDDGPMTLFAAWPEGVGQANGIILYMDIFGLRDEIFAFARIFARHGYATFVPDLFHRLPVQRFEPINEKGIGLTPDIVEAGDGTTLDHGIADTKAVLVQADGLTGLRVGGFGAVGYCMGGRHALAAANAFPERVRVAASLHGGKLVNDTPQSPHKLLETCPGTVYFAFAKKDPTCPDKHKEVLEEALEAGPANGIVKHVDAYHGWSFPTRWAYDQETDEAVRADLLSLFERCL